MPHILIAPDKFKGTLSALEVARAIEKGLRSGFPSSASGSAYTYELLPIADGGEGTTETLCNILGGDLLEIPTEDALGRACAGQAALTTTASSSGAPSSIGILEIAAAAGLWQIEAEKRNPWASSTYGVGLLIKGLIERGADSILAGLGGSVTNDAGFGMAAALGYSFIDKERQSLIPAPQNWRHIVQIIPPEQPISATITVLCDVTNPLLGLQGSSHVYGPQKGVTNPAELDEEMRRMADLVTTCLGTDYRDKPGAGAAGGLGYGFLTFTNATLVEGFKTIAKYSGLEEAVQRADLVITGEGRIDSQTFSGKGPSGIAAMAISHGKPVHLFCGKLDEGLATADLDPAIAKELATWAGVHPLVGTDITAGEALANSGRVLEYRALQLAQRLNGSIAI